RKIAMYSTSGRAGNPLSLRRQLLEARHALRDRVELLLVAGIDRYLWSAVKLGVIERADFEHHRRQPRTKRQQMGAAFGAEFACDCAFKVAALELLGRALGVAEATDRHQHEHVGRTA